MVLCLLFFLKCFNLHIKIECISGVPCDVFIHVYIKNI